MASAIRRLEEREGEIAILSYSDVKLTTVVGWQLCQKNSSCRLVTIRTLVSVPSIPAPRGPGSA